MKTFRSIALAIALLAAPTIHAQNTGNGTVNGYNTYYSWAVALVGLGIAGTVAGLAAAAASSQQSTFSH